jgi:hypothetical protein
MNHPSPLRVALFSCVGLLHLALADAVAAPKRLFDLKGGSQGSEIVLKSPAVVKTQLEGKRVTGRVTPVEPKSFGALTSVVEGEEVEIPLANGETVTGVVNLVHHQLGSLGVAGHLTNEKGSFVVTLQRDSVGGLVQLEGKGTAFRVEPSKDGTAVIREMLRSDVVCSPLPRPDGPAKAAAPNLGPEQIPDLESRPGTVAVLYLDFDGEDVTDPFWNNGVKIVGPRARMNDAQITEAFNRVKEDFWPFNVNVTTVKDKYTAAPVGRRMRCIITANDAAAPGAGGVAYLDSFAEAGTSYTLDIPCWVFIDDDAKACAEAISHEFGHTFGLRHDGRVSPPEAYYRGHGAGATGWAPIMGVGYYQPTVQWSKGEYISANNHEDDLAIISNTKNGIGYVADETPDNLEGAQPLNFTSGAVDQKGIITKSSDADFYIFQTTGGSINLTATGANPSPNLDIVLQLLDSSGNVLATSNPASALNATLSRVVAAGNYFLQIEGTGAGNVGPPADTGYSKYASIGAYTIAGTIENGGPKLEPVITSSGVIPALRGVPINYTITATGAPTSYDLTGTFPAWLNFNAQTGVLSGTPNASGNFNFVMSATNGVGTGTKDLVITVNVGAVSLGVALDATDLVWLSGGDDEWLGVLDVSFDGVDSAESGPIGDNEMTFIETTVQGPAVVQFRWRTETEAGGDFLRFFADGIERDQISGDSGWILKSISFPPGPHALRWEYQKNGSLAVGLDRARIDTVSVTLLPAPVITSANTVIGEEGETFFYQIEADNDPKSFGISGTLPDGLVFDDVTGIISGIPTGPAEVEVIMMATNEAGTSSEPLAISVSPPILTLGESVNAENLEPWVTSGSSNWFPQTVVSFDGLDAAQAGEIFDNQVTQLSAAVIGPTAVRFRWKVDSEPKFDVLEFLVDGVVKGSISGDVDWQEAVFAVPAGKRTLAWRYRKDSTVSIGADTGWLDQVVLDQSPLVLSSRTASGRVGEPFFHRVVAVNTPTSIEAVGLPPGLNINTQTGAISGIPTQLGEYAVDLTITNATGVETRVLTITINETRATTDGLRASSYAGLVRTVADGKAVGLINLKVTAKQTLSGSLSIGGSKYSFRGKLDPVKPLALQLRKKGSPNLTLAIKIDSRADIDLLVGDVQGGIGASAFEAFAAVLPSDLPPGAIGKYTVLFEPDSVANEVPGGSGAATLTVSKSGAVKVSGVLGDGQKFTAAAPLNINKQLPFFSAPYKVGGVIAGDIPFNLTATPVTLGAGLEWSKKPDLSSPLYSPGFTKSTTANGAFYVKPPRGTRVLNLTNGMIRFEGSDLAFTTREQPFTLGTDNRLILTPVVPSLKVSIKTSTGLISGSFRPGATSPVVKFSGAVLPHQNRGAGVFVGTAKSGEIVLEPVPTP